MHRVLVIAMLLISLACQGVAVAAQRFVAAHGDPGHAMLHLHEVAHHHHDGEDSAADPDASVVIDASAESLSHVASDAALSAPALTPLFASASPTAIRHGTPSAQFAFPRSADLERLRRPPR